MAAVRASKMQSERWNTGNLETEGVMHIPDTNILFVDVAHPVWDYVRTNPEGDGILKAAVKVENHYKVKRDGFNIMCEGMRQEMEVQ